MKIRANGFIVFVPKYGSNCSLLPLSLSGHLPLCEFLLHDAAFAWSYSLKREGEEESKGKHEKTKVKKHWCNLTR